jgi:hypothetical protein
MAKTQLPMIDDVLETLPYRIRKKSKTFLNSTVISLNQDGRMLYQDGEIGSSLRDLLMYHFNPLDADGVPPDHAKFMKIVKQKKKKQQKKSVVEPNWAWGVFDD